MAKRVSAADSAADDGQSPATAKPQKAKAKRKTKMGASAEAGEAGTAKAAKKAKAAKPKKASKSGKAKGKGSKAQSGAKRADEGRSRSSGAGDAIVKILESPLMVDLIAVGATAALAAIAEHRFGRDSEEKGTAQAAKSAGKAAAAAVGRRLTSEIQEIVKSTRAAKDGE